VSVDIVEDNCAIEFDLVNEDLKHDMILNRCLDRYGASVLKTNYCIQKSIRASSIVKKVL
jgi:hypothetical protein